MRVVKGWGCRFRRAPPRPPGSRARFILETLNSLFNGDLNLNVSVPLKLTGSHWTPLLRKRILSFGEGKVSGIALVLSGQLLAFLSEEDSVLWEGKGLKIWPLGLFLGLASR